MQFVAQVDPESLRAVAIALADAPMGHTALGVSFAVLLMRRLRPADKSASKRRDGTELP